MRHAIGRGIGMSMTNSATEGLERAKGIEPSYEAWEASVLPLNYARSCESRMAGEEGLEPPTPGFGDRCSNQLSYTPKP